MYHNSYKLKMVNLQREKGRLTSFFFEQNKNHNYFTFLRFHEFRLFRNAICVLIRSTHLTRFYSINSFLQKWIVRYVSRDRTDTAIWPSVGPAHVRSYRVKSYWTPPPGSGAPFRASTHFASHATN